MRESPNRLVALILGIAFALFGVGSVITGVLAGAYWLVPAALLIGIFGTNVAFGTLAIAAGAALVVTTARGVRAARIANIASGTACLLLGLAGLFVVGTPFDVFAMNGADNVLLFLAATIQLAVGLGARRDGTGPALDRSPR